MLNIDKVANKAGIELLDGKNYPPPKQRGAKAWGRLIGWIRKMETLQAEREIELANEGKLRERKIAEQAEVIRMMTGELAEARDLLRQYQVKDRLITAGIPMTDCHYLTTGEKVA